MIGSVFFLSVLNIVVVLTVVNYRSVFLASNRAGKRFHLARLTWRALLLPAGVKRVLVNAGYYSGFDNDMVRTLLCGWQVLLKGLSVLSFALSDHA